jgi:glyceraldehyde 3-phosphate dehydrogenase
MLKVIDENLEIETGVLTTIHSYTNDQNLLDNYHKKPRRGRAAPLNMVITTTGSGAAAAKVIPLPGNKVKVVFDKEQRAITPGQLAVFYDNDVVIGSVWIETIR